MIKRTLLAAVFGTLITFAGGAFTAQAAPLSAVKAPQASENLVQTVGYGHRYHRRYDTRRHYYRPYVRWHSRNYIRPYYARPYYYAPRHRHWSYRYDRRHYR